MHRIASRRKTKFSVFFAECLEPRLALSADGIALGPFLEQVPDAHERVAELANAIQTEIISAKEVDLAETISVVEQFDSIDDIDVFKITTPSLSEDATGNASLYISTHAFSTGSSSIAVLANENGEATNAGMSLFPGLGMLEVTVEPETTYYLSTGQFPYPGLIPFSTDVVGPYEIQFGYVEPLPPPPAPEDFEPDSLLNALPVDIGSYVGYLNDGGDVDYFKYSASENGTLHVFLEQPPLTIAELRIEDADGGIVASEPSFFTPVEVGLDVLAGQEFFISLRSETGVGDYSFHIINEQWPAPTIQQPEDRHGDTQDAATDLTQLGPFWFESGLIDDIADEDWFRISVEEGTSSAIQFTPNEAVSAELLSPAGEVIHTFSVDDSDVLVAQSEDFYLRVTASGDELGYYDFFVLENFAQLGIDPDLGTATTVGTVPTDPGLGVDVDLEPSERGSESEPTDEEIAAMLGLSVEELFGFASLDSDTSDPVVIPSEPPDLIDPNAADFAFEQDPIIGDINLDNQVGFDDFVILSEYYGTEEGAEWRHGDFDADGDVDFADYLGLAHEFG